MPEVSLKPTGVTIMTNNNTQNETILIFYKINPFYGLVSLKRVTREESYDFASFSQLQSKTTVSELNKLIIDGAIQFESAALKNSINHNNHYNVNRLEPIALKIKSGLDCLLSKNDIENFKRAFSITPSTTENDIKNICYNFAAHFKIHGNRMPLLCKKITSSLFDGYRITVGTASEIQEAYSLFSACMLKFSKQMPLFYGTPYNTSGKTSIGVLIFWEKDIMRGRATYRVRSNKIASFYGNDRAVFTALSKKLGFGAIDCSALIGARLPIVVDDNNALLMPYIDSSDKSISLKIDDENGNYLVIGTKLDSLILLGVADSQKLELNNRSHAYDNYFSDDYEKNEVCSNCECDIDEDDYSTDYNGNILCSNCSGYCEMCDETVLQDDMVPALSEQRGSYYRIYVCSCCADNADEHMAVF